MTVTGKSSYTVMIVDDHDMVRAGLKTYLMLEPKFEVIAEAGNGEEALRVLNEIETLPDLILMDLMMPIMDGVQATAAIMERFPDLKIVMLTSFLEDDKVLAAVEAGAVSYVLKTVSAEELIYALTGAVKGMPVMTSDVSQALTRGLRQRSAQGADEGLTEREKEVLLLIADGMANKEIAEELHISIKTVKTHVSNLLMKCELEDRTQLAVYAHRKGWAKPQV
ncbi:two component transcriptional regulator, LuxR family [Paenibacillus curdlanolyticus YK9]|uniref:Two component transcriptional regulator, LuxR family n=1 Tax=Paenibacillus curdlanolyticus YK9 TaxID=717606 RepID=E0IBF0_9BACL|nr:response regulator transcription factor [Paenibacillus curdlanolyticus]EFM10030.1 two component transcriptional regulator, LuxR family [Paenibacillus curdlanolyticus YK9]